MKKRGHLITGIQEGSIAEELGVEPGDALLSINGQPLGDVFDYQYLAGDSELEALIRKANGEEWLLEIDKEPQEDLGLFFAEGLMDEYRTCTNQCVFCFIDQMPEGMRDTLYVKDDDSRLSFLQGNYITLTNMSEEDTERIIRYRLAPMNISVHTTNPDLRIRMLRNRFAGEALKKIGRFYEAGIEMNGQIVLCKGLNDGRELEQSIGELYRYLPYLRSVSVVPVGLSRFREGLYPLEPFTPKEAREVIGLIRHWQKKAYREKGTHFVHASDEWYLLAGEELPEEEAYDGYLQLENGVGMLRLFIDEFEEALAGLPEGSLTHEEELSVLTGKLAYPCVKGLAERLMQRVEGLRIHVHAIRNDYFGEKITVSGLLTGADLIAQGKELFLGSRALLPENILRSGERTLLDGYSLEEVEMALQVPVDIVKSSGYDFLEKLLKNVHREQGVFPE